LPIFLKNNIVKGGKMKKKKECPSWVMKTMMSLLFLLFCFAEQSSFGARLKYGQIIKIKNIGTGDYLSGSFGVNYGGNYVNPYMSSEVGAESLWIIKGKDEGRRERWECSFGSDVQDGSVIRLESIATGGNIQVWTHNSTIGGNTYSLYFWGMSTERTTRDNGILDYGDNLVVYYDGKDGFRLMSDSSHSCGSRYFYATRTDVRGHPDKKEVAAIIGSPANRYWKAEIIEQTSNGAHAEIVVNNLAKSFSSRYLELQQDLDNLQKAVRNSEEISRTLKQKLADARASGDIRASELERQVRDAEAKFDQEKKDASEKIADLNIQTESLTKINASLAKELANIEDYPAGFFKKPGVGLKEISIGKDVIVGEGKGARKVLQAWAIGEDDKLLKWVGGSNPWESHIAQSGTGEEILGFKSISIGFNNDTYAVGLDSKVYHYNPTGEPSPEITKLDEDVVLTESIIEQVVKPESVEEKDKAKEKQKDEQKKDKKKKDKKKKKKGKKKKKKKKKSKVKKKKKGKKKLKKDKKKKDKKKKKKDKKKKKKKSKVKKKKKGKKKLKKDKKKKKKKDGNKGAKEVKI
jgi:hypothetical protein